MTSRRLAGAFAVAAALTAGGLLILVSGPFAALVAVGALLAAIGLSAALAIAVVWIWLRRSRPKLDGELRMSGLRDAVWIRRDRRGTPHIGGSSDRDVFFALGIAMAQDRLWQMDLLRRAAHGRLAEIAGAEAVELDAYARTIGLGRIATEEQQLLDDEERELLQGFADGVNRVIDGSARQSLGFEFGVLRYRPEAWSIADTLAIGKALAWLLSSTLEASILEWRVTARLGADLAALLFGPHPAEPAPAVPASASLKLAHLDRRLRDALGVPPGGAGSNVWALSGRHTRSGRPVLANDIHLGLDYSMRFYEAVLAGPQLHVAGLFVPGAPVAVAASNGRIAWGATNTGVAVSDLYLEELSEDGSAARYDGAWVPLRERRETIRVRGAPARELTVRFSGHGPIVSDLVPLAGAGGRALSLRWAGAEAGPAARALLAVARARDWDTFNAACDDWPLPATNLGYADVDGHIGLRTAGALPIRPRKGLLPLEGGDRRCEWKGYVPAAANPRVFDPAEGWIASANNVTAPDDYPFPITWLPEPPYRIRRIRQVLGGQVAHQRPVGIDEMAQLQRDTISVQALDLLPAMLGRLDRSALSGAELEPVRHLEDWNGNVSLESVAASVWEAWYQHWLTALLGERLEPDELALAMEIPRLNPGNVPWTLADRAQLERWCRTGSPEELARRAFREAVATLQRADRRTISDWDWGALHTITWRHPAARSRIVSLLLDRGPYPAPGDAMTVNAAEFRLSRPYAVALLPVGRMLVDLAAPDRPRFASHPGQSAHPLSQHYDDRIAEFLVGEPHVTSLRLRPEDARHSLHLVPG